MRGKVIELDCSHIDAGVDLMAKLGGSLHFASGAPQPASVCEWRASERVIIA